MIDADFRTHLLQDEGVLACFPAIVDAGKLQQNTIEGEVEVPLIWYSRGTTEETLLHNGAAGMQATTYDLEVIGIDITVVSDIAEAIKDAFRGYFGSMGTTQVLHSVVEDHSDDYQYKNQSAEQVFDIAAIRITLFT